MSEQAIRNQRTLAKAQANFDSREHPDYYRDDFEDVIDEDEGEE